MRPSRALLMASADELGCAWRFSRRAHRAVAEDTPPSQSEECSHVGSNEEAGGQLAPKAANPPPLAMTIRCLVIVVVVCLFGASVNALTMQECRAQYKADLSPKGGAPMSWVDYQVKRCGINPKASAPTPRPSAPMKH